MKQVHHMNFPPFWSFARNTSFLVKPEMFADKMRIHVSTITLVGEDRLHRVYVSTGENISPSGATAENPSFYLCEFKTSKKEVEIKRETDIFKIVHWLAVEYGSDRFGHPHCERDGALYENFKWESRGAKAFYGEMVRIRRL